jgi:DNA-directed RNA polymerase I, II, and III subunit RPABC2
MTKKKDIDSDEFIVTEEETVESENEIVEDVDEDDAASEIIDREGDGDEDDGDEDDINSNEDMSDDEKILIDISETENSTKFIHSKLRITKPFLNIYEKTRVLSTRSKQLSLGAKPLIKIDGNLKLSPLEIATLEFENKMIPFIIRRKLPDGKYELWKVSELEDIYK